MAITEISHYKSRSLQPHRRGNAIHLLLQPKASCHRRRTPARLPNLRRINIKTLHLIFILEITPATNPEIRIDPLRISKFLVGILQRDTKPTDPSKWWVRSQEQIRMWCRHIAWHRCIWRPYRCFLPNELLIFLRSKGSRAPCGCFSSRNVDWSRHGQELQLRGLHNYKIITSGFSWLQGMGE